MGRSTHRAGFYYARNKSTIFQGVSPSYSLAPQRLETAAARSIKTCQPLGARGEIQCVNIDSFLFHPSPSVPCETFLWTLKTSRRKVGGTVEKKNWN